MRPYNPRTNYFGPKDGKLEAILEEILELLPNLKEGWNQAAYRHDVAYTGVRRKGFWGWIADFRDRRRADLRFRDELFDTVEEVAKHGKLSVTKADRACDLAELAYAAVRIGGRANFRTS